MAESTKKTDNAKTTRIAVTLPRNRGQNANQQEFFSVNFKNYIIERGEEVEIPEALANSIKDSQHAEEYAMKYVDNMTKNQKDKEKEFGVN